MIYLDNAATSWPKPREVMKAMIGALEHAGGNPGRSGHRLSIAAARVIYDTREGIAGLFGCADPLRVVFTGNATHALNLALRGILKPGDRVVAGSMEHNASMRPLRCLEKQGVIVNLAECDADGSLDAGSLGAAITPDTKLVVLNHASNVTGTLLPIAELAAIAHRAGALVLVDAAQTAGALPIDIQAMGIDLLAFAGHKELLGPMGIGGLIIAESVDASRMEPLIRGGTGSRSESEEQPEDLPDRFESGTPNLAGIAGLGAGLRWLKERGIEETRAHMKKISSRLIDGLSTLPGLNIYGTLDPERSMAVISFTVSGKRVSEIGFRLDEEFGIMSRVGLHCAPMAHRTIGSFPEGTVRFAPGVFTTDRDIQKALKAVIRIVRS
ncbi:MAG: aminotransferase class V-fold PLP-dependent enzyme [Spirochaetes bacterium]|nr:aminotransferase class V-fold PLP-dependent enzyme [Spirochaetota bacterium]